MRNPRRQRWYFGTFSVLAASKMEALQLAIAMENRVRYAYDAGLVTWRSWG